MLKKLKYRLEEVITSTGSLLQEKINKALSSIFCADILKHIAQKSNFVQRSSSKIKGDEFIQAMVMASIDPESAPLSGINDNLREIRSEAKMTTSALRQRINSPVAHKFLKDVYQITLESHLKPLSNEINAAKDKSNKGALELFTKVLIHDSSSCALNDNLKNQFKGSGGAASQSLVKIDLIYDLKKNCAEEIIFTDIREPDQGLCKRILKHISKSTLIIQDLGYFDIDSYDATEKLGGYYLSRLSGSTLVYLRKEDEQPIQLSKHIAKLMKNGDPLDIEIFVTQKKIKTRLVAYPVPEKVFNKRLRDYYQKNKKKTPSDEWIARQRFTILITNVPIEIWSWSIVGTVYKIRWQIELIFKVWKSQMSIQHLRGVNPERIWCLLYSRMIAVILIFTMQNVIAILSECELSLPKFVNWLKRNGRFAKIILKGFSTDLWKQLVEGLDLLGKDRQRKRKTTRHLIENDISFPETFEEKAIGNA